MINPLKLTQELKSAGIKTCGCNSNGIVWDDNNNEIQNRPDVKAILAKHDPIPLPAKSDKEIITELQAQVAVLSKAIDTTKLTAEEVIVLESK